MDSEVLHCELRIPLLALRDVSLDDLHTQRVAGRGRRSVEQAPREADGVSDGYHDDCRPKVAEAQQRGDERQEEAQAPDATQASQLEHRAVAMRGVAEIGPGEPPEQVEAA